MARAQCARCGKPIPRKTSPDTLCDRCETEDRMALTSVLEYLRHGEGFGCTVYELSNLDGVDEQMVRRWMRLNVLEKSGTAKVALCSKLRRTDRRPPAQLLLELLDTHTATPQDLHSFRPKMVREELVIGSEP